ncbi:hypothetical protein LLG90_25500 [Aromatoleum toluclasticum]|uniref:hypothetical protein n=1 Tax=Aromatoleum toluclasticum TaxID=92003 RepID=UPI001D17F458|nr:hypothetical protein [Aromatoleum toluclasticum]MCC4118719.1 hypothetical protein [Aromatoleum toluclasticum]
MKQSHGWVAGCVLVGLTEHWGGASPMTETYQLAAVGPEAGLDERFARLAKARLTIEYRGAAPSKNYLTTLYDYDDLVAICRVMMSLRMLECRSATMKTASQIESPRV